MENEKYKLVVDIYADEFERWKNFACVYCGSTIEITRDHVISVSWSGYKRSYFKGETVKCCRECNSFLRDIPNHSIEGRALYLLKIYQKRYNKFIQHPFWSADELEQMSDKFQRALIAYENEKKFIKHRIAHLVLTSLEESEYQEVKQSSHDDSVMYKILHELHFGFDYQDIGVKYGLSKNEILGMIRNKKYQNIINIFKYENRIPFDMNLRKYFYIIRSNKK